MKLCVKLSANAIYGAGYDDLVRCHEIGIAIDNVGKKVYVHGSKESLKIVMYHLQDRADVTCGYEHTHKERKMFAIAASEIFNVVNRSL